MLALLFSLSFFLSFFFSPFIMNILPCIPRTPFYSCFIFSSPFHSSFSSLCIDAYNLNSLSFFFIFASRLLSLFRLYKRKYKKRGAFYPFLCFTFYHATLSPQNSHRRSFSRILSKGCCFKFLLWISSHRFSIASPHSWKFPPSSFSQFSFSMTILDTYRTKAFLSKKINNLEPL